jgi:hypothetical protein
LQLATTPPSGHFFHAGHFFVQAHRDAVVAQMVGERLHHLLVGELQQARPLLHQDHAHAQNGEHARVFHADHAAAHHDERLGDFRHIRIWSLLMMLRPLIGTEGDTGRLGAGGDQNRRRFQVGLAARNSPLGRGGVQEKRALP